MSFKSFLRLSGVLFISCSQAHSSLIIKGSLIPTDPREEMKIIVPCPAEKESDLANGIAFEDAENYQKAALAYQRSGISGQNEAFVRLGYLWERKKLSFCKTIQERRLIDAIASYYIERGGQDRESYPSWFSLSLNEDEEEDGEEQGSFEEVAHDASLALGERFLRIGRWYEKQKKIDCSTAEKFLIYAYAGRYYEESALYHNNPQAYTALAHLYYFGRGVDISDMPLSARLQAKEYYKGSLELDDPDSDSQFMLGFLLEEDQTRKKGLKPLFYYELAAQNNTAAAYRLGVRYEQGHADELTTVDFYKKAEHFYMKALQGPRSHLSILVSFPDNLEVKIKKTQKLQQNLEGLPAPFYALLEHTFSQHIQSTVHLQLLPYWIKASLRTYGQKNNLPFDNSETTQNITTVLSNANASQNIPDLPAYEQKVLSFQHAKNVSNPFVEIMRSQQIRKYLADMSDDWLTVKPPEDKKHSDVWYDGFKPLLKQLQTLSEEFDGGLLIDGLKEKVNALSVDSHRPDPLFPVIPNAYLKTLEEKLSVFKQEGLAVFQALGSFERSLKTQIQLYRSLQKIKNVTGVGFSPELLEDILLARQLLKETSIEFNEETVLKYLQSARALRAYAHQENQSIEQAKAVLDLKARQVIPVLSPHLHDFSMIGYDIILKIMLPSGNNQEWQQISDAYRQNLILFLNQENLDEAWTSNNQAKRYVSGSPHVNDGRLTRLYERAKGAIEAQTLSHQEGPYLNVNTLTDQDPTIGVYGTLVSDSLKDIQDQSQALFQQSAQDFGVSSYQEIYEMILDQELNNMRSLLNIHHFPDLDKWDAIMSLLEGDRYTLSEKISRKEDLLFVFRKGMEFSEREEAEKFLLLGNTIVAGMEGRCPDGQAQFTQEWINSYIIEHNEQVMDGVSQSSETSLKILMSLFLQDYKKTFIQKHGSPFIQGERSSHEDRTAMHGLLTQVLRLPLGVTGSYHTVLYPYFATGHLKDPQSIEISKLMNRFFRGGSIVYRDFRTTEDHGNLVYHDNDADSTPELYEAETSFSGTSLKTLGEALRYTLIDVPTRQEQIREDLSAVLPGLLPTPRARFFFPNNTLENFLQEDAVIGSFYTTFIHSDYQQGNIFFDERKTAEYGYKLNKILTDAAVLRLFEVSGYAHVPPEFYETVSKDWVFP